MLVQGQNADGMRYEYYVKQDVDTAFHCDDDGMTRQEFKDECDINVLMATYERTGALPPMRSGEPQYLDVSNVPDLQEALSVVAAAEAAFMRLPAKVRKEFDNDPVKFVEYAENPENLEQMRTWGLAPPKPVEAPPAAPAAGSSSEPGAPGGAPPAAS